MSTAARGMTMPRPNSHAHLECGLCGGKLTSCDACGTTIREGVRYSIGHLALCDECVTKLVELKTAGDAN